MDTYHGETGEADRPPTISKPGSHRALSFVLFLTPPDWVPDKDGGRLRLHSIQPEDVSTGIAGSALDVSVGGAEGKLPWVEISPASGTLVVFDSVEVLHEVRKTKRERLAAVGWYYRDVMRRKTKRARL